MYDTDNLAARIKQIAKERKIQLKDLFPMAEMSKNTMANITGGSIPKADNLAKIADVLGCSVDYLLGREYTYTIIEKQADDHIIYGLTGSCNGKGEVSVEGITDDKKIIGELCDQLNRYQLDPVHLRDYVSDRLAAMNK